MVPAGALPAGAKPRLRVRIVVAEPERRTAIGQRRFRIEFDGATIARDIDPLALAGAPRTAAVLEAEIIATTPVLRLACIGEPGTLPPVIGGILIERLDGVR